MTAAKSQGVKLLGKKKKKNLNGYSAWVKQGKKGGNETVRYIRVSVEQGSNVAQHVILQQISF